MIGLPGQTSVALIHQKFKFPDHSCGILKMLILHQDKLDQRIGERLLEVFEEQRLINNP